MSENSLDNVNFKFIISSDLPYGILQLNLLINNVEDIIRFLSLKGV